MGQMSDLEMFEMERRGHIPPRACDYDTSRGYCMSEGLGCYKGVASWRAEVIYNEVDKDVLFLCDECYKRLKTLIRRQGYKIKAKRYENNKDWVGYKQG